MKLSAAIKSQVTVFGKRIPLIIVVIIALLCSVSVCCGMLLVIPSSDIESVTPGADDAMPTSTTEIAAPPSSTPPIRATRTSTSQPTSTAKPTIRAAATATSIPETSATATPTSPPAPSGPVDLIFEVTIDASDGMVLVNVNTNLPDEMQVMFTMSEGDGIRGQAKVSVARGLIAAGPFSNKGEPFLPGEYSMRISTPLLRVQPEAVQEAVGENGKMYQGSLWSDGRVAFDTTFVIQGDQEAAQVIRTQELEALATQIVYLRNKLDELRSAKSKTVESWTSWSRDWNVDLGNHSDTYIDDFGANINQYTGNCESAFFNVSVTYGDIFILWLEYDHLVTGEGGETSVQEWETIVLNDLTQADTAIEECRGR